MDVRGKAPVYIPPTYPVSPVGVPVPTFPEKRTGLKVRIAFMLTVFFVVLQLHPVMNAVNTVVSSLLMRDSELANEYGCASVKGLVLTAVVFFVLVLIWMRPL